MAVVHVVDVIPVGDGLVTAALAVLVVVGVVSGVGSIGALIPMALVLVVSTALVEVVDMVPVLDGRMPTLRTVDVGVVFVDVMSAHDRASLCAGPWLHARGGCDGSRRLEARPQELEMMSAFWRHVTG
jgi:hypothetical protein